MKQLSWLEVTAWSHYLVTLVTAVHAAGYYHQATPDRACHVSVPEWSTLDLVCQYFDKGAKKRSCRMRSMTWQRLGVRTVTNVTDSPKYGVWDAIPGWGMGDGEHISLLRIRSLEPGDLGTYRCEIQCVDEDGIKNKAYHYADVCLQQPNQNYAICASHVSNGYCAAAFWNGVCDLDCEMEKNMFDGFECTDQLEPCSAAFEGYCSSKFANGICDTNCNTAECAWDGGDCVSTPRKFAEDTLVLFLSHSGWRRRSSGAIDLKELGRSLSKLLRTIVRVLPANWEGDHMHIQPNERTDIPRDSSISLDSPSYSGGRRLFLRLDNSQCKKQCFRKAGRAAQYILAALHNGWDPGIPIASVAVLSWLGTQCRMENNTLLDIDLSLLDRQDGPPDSLQDEGGAYGFQSWILVAAVTGGVCLIVLILALTLVACRLHSNSPQSSPEKRRPHKDPTRIQMEKHGKLGPPGVDV